MIKGRLFFIRCEGWICFTDEKTGKAKTRKIISRNKKTTRIFYNKEGRAFFKRYNVKYYIDEFIRV